jgi:zinc finger HIT domain-containing protein 1
MLEELDKMPNVKNKNNLYKKSKKIRKKKNRTIFLKRNLNLKKLILEENLNTRRSKKSKFANFVNIKAKPGRKFGKKLCSICCLFANYKCPRCRERYCSLKCHNLHKEIICKNFGK